MWRRTGWLVMSAALATAVIYGGLAAVAWQFGRPRLPAFAPAQSTVDGAIVQVVGAAGDSVAIEVGGLTAASVCQRTMLARGHRFTRTADLYTDPGTENALIDRVAAALPATGQPTRGAPVGDGVRPLTASAGAGVELSVTPIAVGWLAATAETDCRTGTIATSAAGAGAGADSGASQEVASLFSALGTAAASGHHDAMPCPGGQIAMEDAVSQTTNTDGLSSRLAQVVPRAARWIATPANRVIWRDGRVSTIVAASDDGTQITVQRTTVC